MASPTSTRSILATQPRRLAAHRLRGYPRPVRAVSSAGREPALQAGGRRFETVTAHCAGPSQRARTMAEARKLDLTLIGEIHDLWNRGEVEATLAYVHPDIEWHTRWLGTDEVY